MDRDVWADSSEDEHPAPAPPAGTAGGPSSAASVGGEAPGTAEPRRGGRGTDYDRRMAELEWNKLQRLHGVDGYREGIEEAKEQKLQDGFDDGFADGAELGMQLGIIRGRASALLHFLRTADVPETVEVSPVLASAAAKLAELHSDLAHLRYEELFPEAHFRHLVPDVGEADGPLEVRPPTTEDSHAAKVVADFRTRLEAIEKDISAARPPQDRPSGSGT
ncbi:hypothetical protein DFJ74DRAFT_702230 [Hyaloraphidium curvatum]|nr:hypothetical protein DFJ74DRAFT_702230 [Hyaloraphidium curvatum]